MKIISLLIIGYYFICNAIAQDFINLKSYLKSIKSVAIEFTQSDLNSQVDGMLIIDKPYKFRCNYYRPFPLLITGSKKYISIYDYEMNSLSRAKIHNNIFGLLLFIDNFDIAEHFKILSAKLENGEYIVKLGHNHSSSIIQITFDKTRIMKKMSIIEDGRFIELFFHKIHIISTPPKKLFLLRDPNLFDKPERLDRIKLKKILKIQD